MEVDHEATKENILPQRKTYKVTMSPSSLKSRDNVQDSSPSSVKPPDLLNATHKGVKKSGLNPSATPKNMVNGKKKATTPVSTPQPVKWALRQTLMDEVDRGEGQVDD